MPSHLDDPDTKKVMPDWATDADIAGNSLADKFAGEAAKEHEVSVPTASTCKYCYELVKKIQWRLITISQNLPERAKLRTVQLPADEKQTLEEKCAQSRHSLSRDGDRLTCSVCLDSFTLKDPAFQHWLAGRCIPATGSKCNLVTE